jgi:diguanylate cyclase (GGDEF)-like protein
MQSVVNTSVFTGFKKVLRKGVLIFTVIITILLTLLFIQRQRSLEGIRSVEHTRQVISYIDTLRLYLLNLDNAVQKFTESRNLDDLDPGLLCKRSGCPNAAELIGMIRADDAHIDHLAPLPALQLALETGFEALKQQDPGGVLGPEYTDLSGFDRSAMDQIHRILIETEREELNQLKQREKDRTHDQDQSSALLALAGLCTILALLGLLLETIRLIRAGVQAEKTIMQLSMHDPLTGLANRRYLQENEKRMFANAKRAKTHMAVLAIDLDDFKAVNDQYGHAAGDHVITSSAERMKHVLRETDVIARLGGDEFVIVLNPVENDAAACNVAARLVVGLNEPIALATGETARIGASIGIAMCQPGDESFEENLKKADAALYAAKREGKNSYRLSDK